MTAAVAIRETLRDAVVSETCREPAKVLAFKLHITDEGARKIQTGQVLPRPEHLAILARIGAAARFNAPLTAAEASQLRRISGWLNG